MAKPFRGVINVDVTQSVPDWEPYTQPIAPDGTPSVLYITLDDVGYSAMGAFGGLIETPNIDRIAGRGLTYTNFHTTALCSPTRSCLMTGRNHTTNGMATITEAASGFPSSNGHIPFECATIAEVLGERGWNTCMVGKWHLTAEDEMNMASRKTQWPVGRGFERFYGFLGADTNQWYPDLVYDNHPVEQPRSPEDGYHLTEDLADKALEFIRDAKAVAPDKPFFLYFCPGACHAPHHAPREWIDKFRGKFDMGYEAYGEQVFQRQKKLGIVTGQAELSAINPYINEKSADGKGWPELDTVRPWDTLSDGEKRLFARMAEVFAGFLAHTDHQIGRLLDYLEASGQLDNTVIVLVSDNGAYGEGGPTGSVNENKIFNGLSDDIEANLPYLDQLGGPATYNHYPTGWAWAFNTPFKLWKRYSKWEGGTADPMIVSWPARITGSGLRRQYVHAIDIVPTLYSVLGIDPPETVKGYTQYPLEGISFEATFNDEHATTDKRTQFYSMGGTRAIDPHHRPAAADPAADPVRVLPRHRRGARVGRAERPQPLLHDRGRGHDRVPGRVRGAVRPRFPVRRPRPLHQGPLPATGTLTLHIREQEAGRGRIMTQPGKFSIAGEGLNIGKDGGEPVTGDYPGQAPWAFTGGTIKRAAIDVSGEAFVDLANEVRLAFMRD
jgi:arylsulfatase A-like enzyme